MKYATECDYRGRLGEASMCEGCGAPLRTRPNSTWARQGGEHYRKLDARVFYGYILLPLAEHSVFFGLE